MSDKENTQTPPESEKKKKLGAGKIILIVIASILAVILIPSAIIFGSLVAQYNKLAYEKHHPVEREDEYVMPDYPEITIEHLRRMAGRRGSYPRDGNARD